MYKSCVCQLTGCSSLHEAVSPDLHPNNRADSGDQNLGSSLAHTERNFVVVLSTWERSVIHGVPPQTGTIGTMAAGLELEIVNICLLYTESTKNRS